jgi:phosphoribosylformylglycinamidine synthase subunit PurQ / glutaminase
MKFGVVVFPGSNCDRDCYHTVKDVCGQDAVFLWHKEKGLSGIDCVVLPGGFSYGDYLRPGAIARQSPIMDSVRKFAEKGGIVIGICNGFQILTEAGLLPGALMRNETLHFICDRVNLKVENNRTPFTKKYGAGSLIQMPIAHMDGNYFADAATLDRLNNKGQVVFRYCDGNGNVTHDANPNGAAQNIAGIVNEKGNVLGLMPHPERISEKLLGGRDGLPLFESIIESLSL